MRVDRSDTRNLIHVVQPTGHGTTHAAAPSGSRIKRVLLWGIHLLIGVSVHGQNLDSLRNIILDPLQPDTERLFSLYDYIWAGYVDNAPDSALLLADSLARFAHRVQQPRHEANGHLIKGNVHLGRGEDDAAYAEFMKALELYGSIGRIKGQANCWNNIAVLHSRKGEHAKAIAAYGKTMDLSKGIGDELGVANALNNIGTLYFFQDDFAPAIDHFQRSLAINRRNGRSRYAAQCLLNIGSCYSRMDNHARSVVYCDSSRVICDSIDAQTDLPAVLVTLGSSLVELGRLDEAEVHLMRAKELAERFMDNPNASLAYTSLARLWLRRGDARKAVMYGEHGLQLAEAIQGVVQLRDATQLLHEAYKAMGNGNKALAMYERFIVLRDSSLKEDNQRSLLRFEYESENEKRALSDSLTFAAEKTIQHKEIQKQKVIRNGFMGGFALVALFAGVFFFQRNRISKEKARSEELLLNILPEEVAEELKAKGSADAVQIDLVTVLFTDFKGFTALSETLSPRELVRDLNECFSGFDRITSKYGIEKIKTIGDAYMAAGGLPTPNTTHATDVIQAALEMRDFVAEGKARKIAAGLPFFEIRIGIHTGPVVAGIVGVKKFQYDIWGDTVNTASRMESSGEVGKVNISEATYEFVSGVTDPSTSHGKPAFTFTPRGRVQAKGKGEMEMFFVDRRTT